MLSVLNEESVATDYPQLLFWPAFLLLKVIEVGEITRTDNAAELQTGVHLMVSGGISFTCFHF